MNLRHTKNGANFLGHSVDMTVTSCWRWR